MSPAATGRPEKEVKPAGAATATGIGVWPLFEIPSLAAVACLIAAIVASCSGVIVPGPSVPVILACSAGKNTHRLARSTMLARTRPRPSTTRSSAACPVGRRAPVLPPAVSL